MALASVTANNGATVQGRLLAQTAAVTLNNNVVNARICTSATPDPTTTTPGETTVPDGATTVPGTGTAPDATTTTLSASGVNISAAMGAGLIGLLLLGAAAMLLTRRSGSATQGSIRN